MSQLFFTSEPILGSVAKTYREWFPLAQIYCFEPFPQSFQKLSENVEKDKNTLCFNTAISDKNGTSYLNANYSSATNSLLTSDERGSFLWGSGLYETTSQTKVSTKTIETFCLETNISHIDILKIDVQGAEFSVLMGAKDLLAEQRISIIYSEIIIGPTYEGQHKLHEYFAFLDSLGYEFLDFFSPVKRHSQLVQMEVIFLSSSFKEEIQKNLQSAK